MHHVILPKHLGQAALAGDLLGLDISLGMIAKLQRRTAVLLGPIDAELAELARAAPASHIDETPWREANQKAGLWVGTGEGVTHFRISRHRDAATARQVLGDDPAKVAICDRYAAYGWVARKQWCWAHTIRTQSTTRSLDRRLLGFAPLTMPRAGGLLRAPA